MNKTTHKLDEISFDIFSIDGVFGDGSHETTNMMLDLMKSCNLTNKSIIDIGTGTGILSVYAALRGAKNILALDINSTSLEWARKNFKHNNVNVDVEINNLTQYIDTKADIILANLPPNMQVENFRTVQKNLTEDGILIISWLNDLKLESYTKDFEIIDHIKGNEYDVYILKVLKKTLYK